MRKDEFFLQVAHAMGGCQAVEQGLKLYLTEAFEAVRLRVAPLASPLRRLPPLRCLESMDRGFEADATH